jgi:DNA repair protein RAD5
VTPGFSSGDSILLSLSISISVNAFQDPNLLKGVDAATETEDSKKNFHTDLKETGPEKLLRERKFALNRLFDKISLHPVVAASGAASAAPKNKGKQAASKQSKRAMLERYDAGALRKRASSEEHEEEEMSEIQLNMVCTCSLWVVSALCCPLMVLPIDKKAIKNDANLPEMEPADTFSLNLRGCE